MNTTLISRALRRILPTACGLALIGAAAVGCGDDDSGDPAPAAGSGGSSGAGGAGQSGGGAAGMAAPIACGTSVCTPQPSPLSQLLGGLGGMATGGLPVPQPVACCVDAAVGTCGTAPTAGAACEPVAMADARCPSIDFGQLGAAAGGLTGNLTRGCCTPGGMCGLDGAIFGRGCVENSEAKAMLGALPFIGTLLVTPPALMCDRPLEEDAGVLDDAGL